VNVETKSVEQFIQLNLQYGFNSKSLRGHSWHNSSQWASTGARALPVP